MKDKIAGMQECLEHVEKIMANADSLNVQDLRSIMHEASCVVHEMSCVVHELSGVNHEMMSEYVKQIDALQAVRDSQLRIIEEQNKIVLNLQEDLRTERARTHIIIDKVLMNHTTNVNVK